MTLEVIVLSVVAAATGLTAGFARLRAVPVTIARRPPYRTRSVR